MTVKILKAGNAALKECVDALAEGKVIIYPTDTAYGLGVDATNKAAFRRLLAIKRRNPAKPVSVAVANIEDAFKLAEFSKPALTLAREFMPGPVTLVLKARRNMPPITLKGKIRIRIPDNKFTLSMLRMLGRPVTATSANISGDKSVYSFKQLDERLLRLADIAVDGAETKYHAESTVIYALGSTPKILREGVIGFRKMEKALNTT